MQAFVARYPGYQSSVRRMLAVDLMLNHRLSVLEQQDRPVVWPQCGAVVFGKYKLLRELGRGAFARVYLATDETVGNRPVALKLSSLDNGETRLQGRIHEEQGDTVAATASYRRALDVSPKSVDARAAQDEARERIAVLTGEKPPARIAATDVSADDSGSSTEKASKETEGSGNCRRFIPATGTTIAVACAE